MKKSSVWTLILLLPTLAILTGLAALPAVCLAQEELSLVMSLDKEGVVQAGDSVTVTLTPSGGRPPYDYSYLMYIDENYEQHVFYYGYVPDNSHTWTVGFGDRVSFMGRVRDENAIVSHSIDLAVQGGEYNPIKITGQSLHPGNVIKVGDTITYSVLAEGGQPPYTYEYELTLYRDGCWSVVKSDGHSSSSFSYTVTSGIWGSFYATVQDALGRKVKSSSLDFTILGDNSVPMELSAASYSLVKLNKDRYRANLQVGVKGCALPVNYVCWWYLFIDGEMTDDRMFSENMDGAFSLEENFDVAIAEVYVTDADGWRSEDFLEIYFNTEDAERPVLSELIRIDLLRDYLKDDLLNYDWRDLIAQRYGISESDSKPIQDVITPELIRPELFKPRLITPELTKPKLTTPEIVQPEISLPGITAPLLPTLKLPSLPDT